ALVPAALSQTVERAMASPFRPVPGAVPAHLAGSVAAVEPDAEAWNAMAAETHVRLRGVPLGPGRVATLVLHRVEPFSADARIVLARRTKDGAIEEVAVARPDAQYWAGTVEGDEAGRAMLARSAAGTMGFVQTSGGTAILSGPPAGVAGPLASFVIADLPEGAFRWDAWECAAEGLPQPPEPEGGAAAASPCRQLRVAVDTDHEFWQRFAGAADQSAACAGYVGTLFAGILQIYDADTKIRPYVSYLRLWQTPADPWDAANTSNQLPQFRDHWVANMGAVPRDVAAMLSGRGLGGGIAWLRAACGLYGYSVSANLAGSFPYPLVNNAGGNGDIMVTAHELGHNVGAPHTHNHCPVPADSCAPSGYFGQCQSSQVCIPTGTIMSYCHLCSGGMANIQLGFHQLSRESIETYMGTSCNTVAGASPPAAVSETVIAMQGQPAVVDVLANEQASNCESVTLDSVEATSAAGHAITVVPPASPDGRPMVRVWAPPSFTGTDQFGYVVREQSGAVTARIEATVVVVPVRWPENPSGDVPGLTTRYYALDNPQQLPDFPALPPIATTTQPDVNYPSTGGNFATSFRADNV
ncbi:MAG: M12 family metallo-peptidase, partial [Phycisphaerales bacterium]